MSALEQDILEKFHQLQPAAQQRVLALIEHELTPQVDKFDYNAWFHDVEMIREQIRADYGDKMPQIDVVGMLRDIRDGEDE